MEAALPITSFGSCSFELGLSSSSRGYATPSSVPSTLQRADTLHLLLLCELQHLPAPCCLAWSTKQLFPIYSSTAEVKHSLMKWDISLWTTETCLKWRICYDRYIPRKGLFCHITILQSEEIILPTRQTSSQNLSIIFSDRKDKAS